MNAVSVGDTSQAAVPRGAGLELVRGRSSRRPLRVLVQLKQQQTAYGFQIYNRAALEHVFRVWDGDGLSAACRERFAVRIASVSHPLCVRDSAENEFLIAAFGHRMQTTQVLHTSWHQTEVLQT